jgi:hypothetical protein
MSEWKEIFKKLGPEDDLKVSNSLQLFLNKKLSIFDLFCKVLKDTGSVVSGGFILDVIQGFEDTDKPAKIYIFATQSGADKINDFLKFKKITSVSNQTVELTEPEKYSPLRKNNIIARMQYTLRKNDEKTLNIMIVGENSNPYKAVASIDFTFCRILFDGETVKATHPEHIRNREGDLGTEYLPLINYELSGIPYRIRLYTYRGFTVNYNKMSPIIGNADLYGDDVSEEENIVSILHDIMTLHLAIKPFSESKEIGVADIYINWLYISKNRFQNFLELCEKLIEERKCILPFWIQNKFNKKQDIMKALLINVCMINTYLQTVDISQRFLKYVKRIMNLRYIDIDKLEDLYNEIEKSYTQSDREKEKDTRNLYICFLNHVKNKIITQANEDRKNTRNIEWLNIVKTDKQPKSIEFKEREIIERSRGCIDVENLGAVYNINAYLKGEAVEGYNQDPTQGPDEDYFLERVSAREASKRLVFFLAKSKDKLDDLDAYCYNIDRLSKNVGSDLYTDCPNPGSMRGVVEQFGKNPFIKLPFDDSIYVPLSEILEGIYKTQKQVFILIPTDTIYTHTSSISAVFGNGQSSGHNCAEETKKRLHTLRVCEGKGDDLCWPVNDTIEMINVEPDVFFLKQKYFVNEKLIDKHEYALRQLLADEVPLTSEDQEELDRSRRELDEYEERVLI